MKLSAKKTDDPLEVLLDVERWAWLRACVARRLHQRAMRGPSRASGFVNRVFGSVRLGEKKEPSTRPSLIGVLIRLFDFRAQGYSRAVETFHVFSIFERFFLVFFASLAYRTRGVSATSQPPVISMGTWAFVSLGRRGLH